MLIFSDLILVKVSNDGFVPETLSAIIIAGALVLPELITGIMDASTMRNF